MRALHDSCQQMAARSITKLSVTTPDLDFRRWNLELRALVSSHGPDFLAALDFTADIPAPAVPGVLTDEPIPLTAPQMRQQALYSLISNSIDIKDEPGSARRIIKDLQHGAGSIGGTDQAYPALMARYQTEEPATNPTAVLHQLLNPTWPRKISQELYQTHVRNQVRLAEELGLAPGGNSDANKLSRQLWCVAHDCCPAQRLSARGSSTTCCHAHLWKPRHSCSQNPVCYCIVG